MRPSPRQRRSRRSAGNECRKGNLGERWEGKTKHVHCAPAQQRRLHPLFARLPRPSSRHLLPPTHTQKRAAFRPPVSASANAIEPTARRRSPPATALLRLRRRFRHRVRPSGVELDVPRVEVPVEHLGHAIVWIGDETVERHGHDCDPDPLRRTDARRLPPRFREGHSGEVICWSDRRLAPEPSNVCVRPSLVT